MKKLLIVFMFVVLFIPLSRVEAKSSYCVMNAPRNIVNVLNQFNYSCKVKQEAIWIMYRESSFNIYAKNRHSSATGLFQFLTSTWRRSCGGGNIYSPYLQIKCGLKQIASGHAYGQWYKWWKRK